MRRLLDERDFPVAPIRYFASARSAGTTLPWRGEQTSSVEDVETADLSGIDIALFSAGGGTSKVHAPAVRGGRRDRHRQLLRLAPRPAGAARGLRGEPGGARRIAAQGIVANPNCTTMAAMPVLQGRCTTRPACAASIVSTYQAVSGSGLAGAAGAGQPDPRGRRAGHARARARRLRRDVPGAGQVRREHRVRRHPARGLDRRGRAERDRRGAEAAPRVAQDPRHPRPAASRAPACACPVFTGHSLSVNAEFEPPRSPERATELLADAPGRRGHRRPDAARRGRAATRRSSAASAPTRARPRAAGSRCSSATTTCARAPRSTRCRSPSCSPRSGSPPSDPHQRRPSPVPGAGVAASRPHIPAPTGTSRHLPAPTGTALTRQWSRSHETIKSLDAPCARPEGDHTRPTPARRPAPERGLARLDQSFVPVFAFVRLRAGRRVVPATSRAGPVSQKGTNDVLIDPPAVRLGGYGHPERIVTHGGLPDPTRDGCARTRERSPGRHDPAARRRPSRRHRGGRRRVHAALPGPVQQDQGPGQRLLQRPRACPTTRSRRSSSRRPTTATRPPPRRSATGCGSRRSTAG